MECRYLNYEWDCRVEIEDDKITIMFQTDDFPIELYSKNFKEVPIVEVTTDWLKTGIQIENNHLIGYVREIIYNYETTVITGKMFKGYYLNTNIKSIDIEVLVQTGKISAINIYPA